ncbi:hypothetical protein [Antarcticimicrobium luteum]|uniref:Uncharacterized protein n=1 Tax=Antarcticimicrobium luteum TaxID=2547397 RepID=A0A4R5VBU4_9RHOB|nr:hypothetical protein [Antarcticimicrobium luteum]TDK49649.1 hypothetical protein E1832_08620 [Antarcticimicrobium luteum]
MARLIDCSIEDVAGCQLLVDWKGRLQVRLPKGWKVQKYSGDDIASIREIDEEQYRSGGRAVAGAIIGGVLTGGVGFLAGAAIGGRRRKTASYLMTFNDGHHVAFEEKSSSVVKFLSQRVEAGKIKELTATQEIPETDT